MAAPKKKCLSNCRSRLSSTPFIVINDQDARAAWSFTALHEVAHLGLGTTGVSPASITRRE